MKPAAFEYHRASSLEAALQMLAEVGDDAKLLAGGQSLVPAMNFRLARPAHIIDLNPAGDLAFLSVDDAGLRVGAMTRQRDVERSSVVADRWPLLTEAVRLVGHVPIRVRGTIGGSLAHADPAAELPAVMVALDARVTIGRQSGSREVDASDFFVNYMTTVLEPDEILQEVTIAPQPANTGYSFMEFSRRHGDFAIVGVATAITVDERSRILRVTLVYTGVGPVPERGHGADEALVGQRASEELFATTAAITASRLRPEGDIHADGEYRQELAAELTRRGLAVAYERAVDTLLRERSS